MPDHDENRFNALLKSAIGSIMSGASPEFHLRRLADDLDTLKFADHDVRSELEARLANKEYLTECANELEINADGCKFTYDLYLVNAKQLIAFFEAHVDRFESVFVSILAGEPHTLITKHFARGDHSLAVNGMAGRAALERWSDQPFHPAHLLTKAYFETRPVDFFKGIEMEDGAVGILRSFIGTRLLEENAQSSALKRSFVESEFCL